MNRISPEGTEASTLVALDQRSAFQLELLIASQLLLKCSVYM